LGGEPVEEYATLYIRLPMSARELTCPSEDVEDLRGVLRSTQALWGVLEVPDVVSQPNYLLSTANSWSARENCGLCVWYGCAMPAECTPWLLNLRLNLYGRLL